MILGISPRGGSDWEICENGFCKAAKAVFKEEYMGQANKDGKDCIA